MPTTLTRLELRRIHNARAAARRISRQVGRKLQPKEPLFYGSNRREERQHVGAYLQQQREHERDELARLQRNAPWERAEYLHQQRIDRAEQAFSPRRLKAAYARIEAGVPLHRAEQRLARLYAIAECIEADQRMWRNCF